MWRFILIAALFISAFSPSGAGTTPIRGFTCSNGLSQYNVYCRDQIPAYRDCPAMGPPGYSCLVRKQYCSATELVGDIPNSSLATFGCRPGFTYDETQSVCIGKEDRGAPVMGCAPECYRKDGQCMRTTPADHVCARHQPHPSCLLRTLKNRSSCPMGYYKFAKTNCGWGGLDSIICPDRNKVVDQHTARCFTNEACPESQHCQVGTLENNRCMLTVRRPKEWFCPNSITLRFRCVDECTSNINYHNPVVKCPDGYEETLHGEQCLSSSITFATRSS